MDMMCEARGAMDLVSSSARERGFNENFLFGVVLGDFNPSNGCNSVWKLCMTGDGMTVINGETVTSQKIKVLGKSGDYANMKMDMGLMPARDGNNYGFEFVKRDGKAFLNVQLLQNSMDARRSGLPAKSFWLSYKAALVWRS
jgi:hypothetical protein